MLTYFPQNVFNRVQDKHYSEKLNAFQEPTFITMDEDEGRYTFRFLYLPTFNRPVVIRAELSESRIVCKIGGGHGLLRNDRYRLTEDEVNVIDQAIVSTDFWTTPPQDLLDDTRRDGADWIFEGVRQERYHLVKRWSPGDDVWRRLGETLGKMVRGVGPFY
jgi:hypothetical protein